ncbi:hypothetical protein C8R45DRAFT_825572, partial [Mycena sanguinolenta]
ADALGMHRHTLRNYLKQYNVYRRFSVISDADLDILTKQFKKFRPASGLRYLIGFLSTHGLKFQREKVRQSLRHVDRLGRILRKHTLQRREYVSPRPNFTWHMGWLSQVNKMG